jgi:thiol-disulfide isomerase/thioredoxin
LSKSIRLTVILLAIIGVTVAAYFGFFMGSSAPDLETGTDVGQLAPDFTLTDLQGNSFTLSSYRGKTVIVGFMSTTCHFCRVEMPELVRFHEEYKTKDVVLMSLDVRVGSTQSLRQFKEEFGAEWIFAPNADDVAREYKIFGIPTKFLIDPNGVIVWKKAGASTYAGLSSRVDEL